MQLLLPLLLLVCVGCTSEVATPAVASPEMLDCHGADPSECAIEHYTAITGLAPRADCAELARAMTFRWAPGAPCGLAGASACLSAYGPAGAEATFSTDREASHEPWVAAHEVMHALLRCQTGNFDDCHVRAVWAGLRGTNNC